MIAYLFFHELAPDGDAIRYEEGLRRFHSTLAQSGVPGFIVSQTYRVGSQYCDWYIVENSAALDPLNDAAVTGQRSASHADVARVATNFSGKLLKLAAGEYSADATIEIRFAKPHGMTYPHLYRLLERWTSRGDVSLWRRMMVLGPAPEFCLVSRSEVDLPRELDAEVLKREPV